MIKIQNLPQMPIFNFTSNNNRPKINNSLERTPQFDTVNFTGKQQHKPIEPIYELSEDDLVEDDVIELSDDDLVIEPEFIEVDPYEKEDERRRRQQEQDDIQLMNDIAVYSVLADDIYGTDYDSMNDDYSQFDNGFDDFGF